MTPRPGSLVVYWDRDEALLGLVVGEERQRVRLLRPRGRDERVRPERIAVVITDGGTPPGADPAARSRLPPYRCWSGRPVIDLVDFLSPPWMRTDRFS